MFTRFLATVTCIAATACANRPDLPIASNICIDVPQETPAEADYVRRKATEYLRDYGFRIVTEDCHASVHYAKFGAFQAESIGVGAFWVSRNGYWSQEGIVTVKQGSTVMLEDYPVNLRGYKSKQDLLNDLAWAAVKPVTWLYQSAPTPKPAR